MITSFLWISSYIGFKIYTQSKYKEKRFKYKSEIHLLWKKNFNLRKTSEKTMKEKQIFLISKNERNKKQSKKLMNLNR